MEGEIMRFYLPVIFLLLPFITGLGGSKNGKETKFEPNEMENKVLEMTNLERKKKDLPPLKFHSVLAKVARDHSANMAKQEKLEHVLDDKTPKDRIQASHYPYRFIGENIAMGDIEFNQIMKAWMESEKHRDNILSPNYDEIGIGAVKTEKGIWYYTQVFGKQLK
jgi:uncharacterized protein YkwD